MAILRSSCTSLRLLLFKLLDHAPGVHHVGVLVGEALQQRVQVALLRVDAAVDLGRGDRHGRLLQQAARGDVGTLRLFHVHLALGRVARIFGLAQLQPRLVELRADRAKLAGHVLAVGRLELDVAQP